MPCCDVIELLAYWRKNPPMHLMVKAYLGIEDKNLKEETNPLAMREAMHLLGAPRAGGAAPAKKIAEAPQRTREIFERMKKKNAG